jgi:hypothetical protein
VSDHLMNQPSKDNRPADAKSSPRRRRWLFRLGPVLGLGALAWFLIRVIPKPSRAEYPCQRAAFPVATGFILWLTGMLGAGIFFGKGRQMMRQAKYAPALACFVLAGVLGLQWWNSMPDNEALAITPTAQSFLIPNHPVGTGKGIFPGRVTWVYDPAATTWDGLNNTSSAPYKGWWGTSSSDLTSIRASSFTDQTVVTNMMAKSVEWLTGTTTTNDAWDRLFHYFNKTHYNYDAQPQQGGTGLPTGIRGDRGYTAGEKIFIKVNWVTGSSNNTLPVSGQSSRYYVHPSVEIIKALLGQLKNAMADQLGIDPSAVDMSKICMGDPIRNWPIHIYKEINAAYPGVKYIGTTDLNDGATKYQSIYTAGTTHWYTSSYLNPGGSPPVTDFTNYTVGTGYSVDHVPDCWDNAAYVINLAQFKTHARNGVSLAGKSYIGSLRTVTNSFNLHKGLMNNSDASTGRDTYGIYRSLVDLSGHRKLGGNVILNVTDGLYCGYDWSNISPPLRWYSLPKHTDPNDGQLKYWWSSSIFTSVDPVAIDSLGLDLWKIERYASFGMGGGKSITDISGAHNSTNAACNPTRTGVEDYLLEMAMADNPLSHTWYMPDGINRLKSLGTFETLNITGNITSPYYSNLTTWQNFVSDTTLVTRKYSRNLGSGPGVELIMADSANANPLSGAQQQIAGRYPFYNNSAWDNNNPAANDDDDAAVDTFGKIGLLPGGTATFANYTSYDKGLNGVMIDVYDATDAAATDFICSYGEGPAVGNPTGTWYAITPREVLFRSGKGYNGSARITLTFGDDTGVSPIKNKWLRVQMIANAGKGLPDDVFYLGNAPCDTGNSLTNTFVDTTDELRCRNDPQNTAGSATLTNNQDFNRDKVVNAADENCARAHPTNFTNSLKLITAP